MGCISLLAEARTAGLVVEAVGDRLVIKGPKRAAAIAQALIQCKVEIMAALAATAQLSPPGQLPAQPEFKPAVVSQGPMRENPARVTVQGEAYDVAMTSGMWFFQMAGHPEAGWTCCSNEFAEMIAGQLPG